MTDDDLRARVAEMNRAMACLALEVPASVHEDVMVKWRAVLAALPRYERIPTMALSLTDEWIEGVPFSVHRKVGDPFCGDESICAQHEPVYRRIPTAGGQR